MFPFFAYGFFPYLQATLLAARAIITDERKQSVRSPGGQACLTSS
jgi:hypothetical protein